MTDYLFRDEHDGVAYAPVRKDTFQTIYYKGEYIHMHYEDGLEIIQALGRYWASLKAAKRAISIQEGK